MQPPLIEPFERDLSRAHTLPARWYVDSQVFELEQRQIFRRTWQPVGRIAQVSRPGEFFTCEVAREPVVVIRDLQGELRAFLNVCRHRAGAVAEGCGQRKTLQCHYHGWTYGLDGRLLSTPEFEGVQDFDRSAHGLVPVQATAWGPFVFVNLDPSPIPLTTILGAIVQETQPFDLEHLVLCERRDYRVACNWKVYVDNHLEGYHVPTAHPGLYKELDYANYRVETFRYYSAQHAPIRQVGADGGARQYTGAEAGSRALYYWIFPNWMLNIYPDNLSLNVVIPLGVSETLTVFEWYFREPKQPEATSEIERAVAFSDQIQREDIKLCEAVQMRLGSKAYDTGRFSVKRENGVHHFQGLVHEFVSEGVSS
jgi:choline monooxygenase